MTGPSPLSARTRRFLVSGLTGLILGSLPGIGLLLWSDHRAPIVLHDAAEPGGSAADKDGFPASTAYRVKRSPWENPNG